MMDAATISRYQPPSGDIYLQLVASYGVSVANSVATAALTGDEIAVNAAIPGISSGIVAQPLNTNTASIFGAEIVTDPLGAPVEYVTGLASRSLNDLIGGVNTVAENGVKGLVGNPFALVVGALAIYGIYKTRNVWLKALAL